MRRYPVEPTHPFFQPFVVPVHMLDVIRTHDSFPSPVMHHLMRYSLLPTETGIHTRSIAAEHRIPTISGLSTVRTVLASSRSN